MARAPYQVLVLPYVEEPSGPIFALFRRSDDQHWQGIAGGGEDSETPEQCARREALEEGGIGMHHEFIALDSMCMIPVVDISGFQWGATRLVIPEWTFAVKLEERVINLSHEHSELLWLPYAEARAKLRWESNRTAIWELNYRIINGLLKRSALA
jgi:dATP pyrophosphohydrolase